MNLIVKRYSPVIETRTFKSAHTWETQNTIKTSGFKESADGLFCSFSEARDEIDRLEGLVKKLREMVG